MGRKWKSVVAMVVSLMMLLTIVPMSVCAMQIFIKIAVDDGYDHYTLEVEPTDRIEDIRAKIYEKKGSPIYQQVLTFAGKVLEDGNSLQDYSIQKDSTINLTLKAHMNDITIVNADYIEDDIYWFGKGKGPTVIPAPGYVISNQENGTYGDSVSFQQGDIMVVYLKNARGEKLEGLDLSKHIKFDTEAPVIHNIEDGGKYYGMNVFSFEDTITGIASLEIDGVETVFSPMEPTIYITPDNAEHVIAVTDKVGNVTTYTVFVYKNYCVTYVVDGKKIDEQYVGYGKDAKAPEIPKKEGYTDVAPVWDHNGKNITADIEINAVYTKNAIEEVEQENAEHVPTGDASNLWLWATLMLISGSVLLKIVHSKA